MAQSTFLNAAALDQIADALTITGISLHSGAPGAAGDGNVVKGAVAATFSASEDNGSDTRKRVLAAQVDMTGMTPLASVVNIGIWSGVGLDVWKGYLVRTSGDAAVNAAGEYSITTATKLVFSNSPS